MSVAQTEITGMSPTEPLVSCAGCLHTAPESQTVPCVRCEAPLCGDCFGFLAPDGEIFCQAECYGEAERWW